MPFIVSVFYKAFGVLRSLMRRYCETPEAIDSPRRGLRLDNPLLVAYFLTVTAITDLYSGFFNGDSTEALGCAGNNRWVDIELLLASLYVVCLLCSNSFTDSRKQPDFVE